MSRCSKKCNEICEKVKSISDYDDDFIYGILKVLEEETDLIVNAINDYTSKHKLNGSCFRWEKDFKKIGNEENDK